MTRKHFAAIAAVIARIPDTKTRSETAVNLALEFIRFNPEFNRQKFLVACGCSPNA